MGLGVFFAVAVCPADQPPPSGTPRVETIVVTDCLTQFPHRRRLASERPGILAEVPDEGARFAPGAIVARLRDAVPRTTLAVAEKRAASDVEIKSARKAHELAELGFNKMTAANAARPGTFTSDQIRQPELDEATRRLEVEVAEHEFAVAQLEVEQHRAELATYEIRTDRGGMISRVVKKDGEGVQTAEEVLEIVDTSIVRVEGFADGRYLTRLAPGMPVEVRVALPTPTGDDLTERFTGKLGFVDVTLTSGREVRVWADVANRGDLLREGLDAELVVLPPWSTPTAPSTTGTAP